MANLKSRLDGFLGLSIAAICNGRFHDTSANHCAHFVSHALDMRFSYHCRQFKGGNGNPANIRVHEIFAECPVVGRWSDHTGTGPTLIFVTAAGNVNLSTKTMANVPKKHIGIFLDGAVYHYSNSQNRVILETPTAFKARFDSAYGGPQALFFGRIPGSDLRLTVHEDATRVRHGIFFELTKTGSTWHAAPDGEAADRFLVGSETTYKGSKGLMIKASDRYGPRYSAADFVGSLDHWAQLLEFTGYCESANVFNTINTYDTAKFTFGFYQLAAHTPRDNLIFLFRRMAGLATFKDYFPELELRDGVLTRVDQDGSATSLETVAANGRLQAFMDYLNPSRGVVERQEVLHAARLIHWSNSSAEFRELQVRTAAEILQHKVGRVHHGRYNLEGRSDVICAIIADIHHQGRAKVAEVRAALAAADPVEALITVNPAYSGRIADLRKKLAEMKAEGRLGAKRYDAVENAFL